MLGFRSGSATSRQQSLRWWPGKAALLRGWSWVGRGARLALRTRWVRRTPICGEALRWASETMTQ